MNIRDIKKLKFNGKIQKIKVAENLYVYVQKESKVYKFVAKKESKKIEATIDNIDNITLTQAKKIVQNLKAKITDKSFAAAREIIRAELAKKQSHKDKEITAKIKKAEEKYLLKNLMLDFMQTRTNLKEINRINTYILPLLGEKDVRKLKTKDIFIFFEQVKNTNTNNKKATRTKNKVETAKKLRQTLNVFFKYIAKKFEITNNPVALIELKDLENIFGKLEIDNYKAITNLIELQDLYKKINSLKVREETGYIKDISIYTKSLMQFLMLNALRIGTAKKLNWEMVDWNKKVINIPASITKTRINFRLPLTTKSINILENLKQYNTKGLIFKNRNGGEITETTINKHLKKLSNNKTTSHGFRSSFSTILKEKGENYLYIETQLMHTTENKIGKAYTRTDYLQQRKELLEKWGELIDPKKQENRIKSVTEFFKETEVKF